MAIYAIMLNESDDDAWEKLKAAWPDDDHVIDHDTVAFVRDDTGPSPRYIADTLGMTAEGTARGIVVQMDNYAGRTRSSLVSWVKRPD